MAWDEYYAVRSSNLYEHKGLAKPLLSLIALLIIGEPEEDEQGKPKTDRDPNAGFCTATQKYLAAQLGCGRGEVNALIKRFVEDCWLQLWSFRDRAGHSRNYYSFTADALKRIEERQMLKDEDGEYVRESGRGQSAEVLAKTRKRGAKKSNVDPTQTLGRPYADTNESEAEFREHIRPSLESKPSRVQSAIEPSLESNHKKLIRSSVEKVCERDNNTGSVDDSFTQKRTEQDQKPQPLGKHDYFQDGFPYPNNWYSLSAGEKRQLIADHRVSRKDKQTPGSAPPPKVIKPTREEQHWLNTDYNRFDRMLEDVPNDD